MSSLSVVVALDPVGTFPLKLPWGEKIRAVAIKIILQLVGGEEALHHRIVPAIALAGHAAFDLLLLQQALVFAGCILAAALGIISKSSGFTCR